MSYLDIVNRKIKKIEDNKERNTCADITMLCLLRGLRRDIEEHDRVNAQLSNEEDTE